MKPLRSQKRNTPKGSTPKFISTQKVLTIHKYTEPTGLKLVFTKINRDSKFLWVYSPLCRWGVSPLQSKLSSAFTPPMISSC